MEGQTLTEASGGTYNLVEKIDTAISNINLSITTLQSNSSVSTTGPFVPTFSSEVNCTAAAVNSGYSYCGSVGAVTVVAATGNACQFLQMMTMSLY